MHTLLTISAYWFVIGVILLIGDPKESRKEIQKMKPWQTQCFVSVLCGPIGLALAMFAVACGFIFAPRARKAGGGGRR